MQQTEMVDRLSLDQWRRVEGPYAWSGLDDGRIIVSAGVIAQWPGRAIAWGLLADGVDRYALLWIHRRVLAFLQTLQRSNEFRRVEATARADYPQASRWLESLGFMREGRLHQYAPPPDCCDHYLYARFSQWLSCP